MTPDEARAILRSGNFAGLIGVIETDQLEAKSEPYPDTNLGHFELAKDVSALANARGGIIIIGVRTERFPERQADEITEVRLVPRGLINVEQYLALIRGWIHPPPQNVEVEWFPSQNDAKRGLVGIFLPAQVREEWPRLIGNYVDAESGRIRGIVFGYAERIAAGVESLTLHDLYGLIRDGRRFAEFGSRLDRIEDALRARPARGNDDSPAPVQSFDARRDDSIRAAGLDGNPTVVLAAIPSRTVEIPGMFRGAGSPVHELLHQPPELRDGSFHLAGPAPQIVNENAQRSLGHGVVLELWSDGTLIGGGDASDFLCWGTRGQDGTLRINTLALVEVTYLFVELARRLYALMSPPEPQFAVTFRLSLHRMVGGGRRAFLNPWPRRSAGFQFGMDARESPGTDHEFETRVEGRDFNAGRVTYELIRRVYRWFGFNDEQVPYVTAEPEPAIDPDRIREDGARP